MLSAKTASNTKPSTSQPSTPPRPNLPAYKIGFPRSRGKWRSQRGYNQPTLKGNQPSHSELAFLANRADHLLQGPDDHLRGIAKPKWAKTSPTREALHLRRIRSVYSAISPTKRRARSSHLTSLKPQRRFDNVHEHQHTTPRSSERGMPGAGEGTTKQTTTPSATATPPTNQHPNPVHPLIPKACPGLEPGSA